jgi:hypothetical protein
MKDKGKATIIINEDYKVEVDEDNLTLFKKIVDTKAKKVNKHSGYKVIGYYGTWEHIGMKLISLSVLDKFEEDSINDLQELIAIIKQSKDEVIAVLREKTIKK